MTAGTQLADIIYTCKAIQTQTQNRLYNISWQGVKIEALTIHSDVYST
jgi:hypothetical protein